MLEIESLTTRYGSIAALRDATLRIEAGEIVGVIGPNGAGKTTLLNSIAGLLSPAGGRVRLDGSDVTGAAPDKMLRAGVASCPTPPPLRRPPRAREPPRGGSHSHRHASGRAPGEMA